MARLISVSLRTGEMISSNTAAGRAASIEGRNIREKGAESGLKMTVVGPTRGAISFSSCAHFAPMLGSSASNPVMLPPGDETLGDRVRDRDEHDGYGAGRPSRGHQRRREIGDQDI